MPCLLNSWAQKFVLGAPWLIQYVFIHARRSYLPKAVRKVSIVGPVYLGTEIRVPLGPVVVLGEGKGSYWRLDREGVSWLSG